jgi:probable HAF family extracellular repeat protein
MMRMRLSAHRRTRAGERAVLWAKTGQIHDLGTLPGDTSSEASALNNNGVVVGYSKGPQGMRAFLWTQATGMQDLGMLPGGNSSRALDVNDMGVWSEPRHALREIVPLFGPKKQA